MVETIANSIAIPPDPVLRLSVDQYHSMIRSGILATDDPVELLEGWLILNMPKNPLHSATTRLIRQILERHIPDGWIVDSQEPITLSDSEPEPDVFVIQGDAARYINRHPSAADVPLIIEVSDTTLQRDRELKKRIYANSGIPSYWIANLVEQQIEMHTKPSGPTEQPNYEQLKIYNLSDEIPLSIDGNQLAMLAVQDLFPQQR